MSKPRKTHNEEEISISGLRLFIHCFNKCVISCDSENFLLNVWNGQISFGHLLHPWNFIYFIWFMCARVWRWGIPRLFFLCSFIYISIEQRVAILFLYTVQSSFAQVFIFLYVYSFANRHSTLHTANQQHIEITTIAHDPPLRTQQAV